MNNEILIATYQFNRKLEIRTQIKFLAFNTKQQQSTIFDGHRQLDPITAFILNFLIYK